MHSYVILLRGVTPTGKNRTPMAELREALRNAGLQDVQTYIQSGNVLTRSAMERVAIETLVHDVIVQVIGADLAVMARTHAEVQAVLAGNPFPLEAAARTYFTLLASRPPAELVEELLRIPFAPDEIRISGTTLYTLYATKLSDSKFHNNYFGRKLKTAATTRNFNTMSRLVELSQ